jgi:phosphatidylserine synthase
MTRLGRLARCIVLLGLVALVAVFEYGPRQVALVTLIIGCAYLNVLLVSHAPPMLTKRDKVRAYVRLSAFVANIAVLYLTDLSLVAALVVWMPAVAGTIAAKLAGGASSGRR